MKLKIISIVLHRKPSYNTPSMKKKEDSIMEGYPELLKTAWHKSFPVTIIQPSMFIKLQAHNLLNCSTIKSQTTCHHVFSFDKHHHVINHNKMELLYISLYTLDSASDKIAILTL